MSFLTGCAISTPFPKAITDDSAGAVSVVLVLTRVVVKPGERAEFDQQNARVLVSIRSHPGLLAYSARREILGSHGWTMTVWANDDARRSFVNSAVHKQAMEKGMPSVVDAEFKRLTLPRRDVPKNWKEAMALLDQPEGRRSYWQ